MKVFVAGASGAIGRPLIPKLIAAGHEVTGMTRREERAEEIRAAGAKAVVCDVFDRPALEAAVGEAAPEAVVHMLTAIPKRIDWKADPLAAREPATCSPLPAPPARAASSPRASPSSTRRRASG
jgi:nucleoside-diphosphate-sugar epimerase